LNPPQKFLRRFSGGRVRNGITTFLVFLDLFGGFGVVFDTFWVFWVSGSEKFLGDFSGGVFGRFWGCFWTFLEVLWVKIEPPPKIPKAF